MKGEPPPKRRPKDLAGYLEQLSKPVFQAGMSWRVIEAKWDGISAAFGGFDPEIVVGYGPDEVDRLVADPRIVRSRPKIEATIHNAETLLGLDAQPGGFRRWLRGHGDFEATVAALKREFRFIGDSGAYFFLYTVGEPVPPHDEWFGTSRPRRSRRSAARGAS